MSKTVALQFAARLGEDGQKWVTDDGIEFEELAWLCDARYEQQDDRERYQFPDGSAVVVHGDGWDLEGPELFSWASVDENGMNRGDKQ